MGIQELVNLQEDLYAQITRALSNYKKSKNKVTKSYIDARLELLESNFTTFKNNHLEIMKCATSDEKKSFSYFKEDCYYCCEDGYLELKTMMKEQLDEWIVNTSCNSQTGEEIIKNSVKSLKTRLPMIEIPTFSGNYNEWSAFHDLFKSLIHDNAELTNVEKYHYLKSNLRGEAEMILRQFPLTDSNYEKALELLESRYNNKRLIVHSHITRLLGQKKILFESAKAIRSLLDTMNETLNALNNIGVSTSNWDPLVTHIIVAKFDTDSHRLWEQQLGGSRNIPTITQLSNFMEIRFRTLEAVTTTQLRDGHSRQQPIKTFKGSIEAVCIICSKNHFIYNCKDFVKLSPEERQDVVKEKQLCYNCLVPRHSVRFCKQTTSCRICKRRHHSLLHTPSIETQQTHAAQVEEEEIQEDTSQLAVYKADISGTQVLLATALVRVLGNNGKHHILRALIDQGSQASFITTSAAQRLGLRRQRIFSKITGVDPNLSATSKEVVGFNLFSVNNDVAIVKVKAHILRTLASILPGREMQVTLSSEMISLPLADPTFCKPSSIDLLLGAEVHAQIIVDGLKKYNSIIAQNSHLGWLISGKIGSEHTEINEVLLLHSQFERDDILQRFWESEELNTKTRKQTASELECEKIFDETHSRDSSGRYVVALPFSTYNGIPLGESKQLAVKRLLHMERRFQRDNIFYERYKDFMDEYETLGHMEKVLTTQIDTSSTCYLPHHGVLREESVTTKLRVVFDGSAETSTGTSLNEKLLIGPALQNDIGDIFLRWRKHKICLVADIQRMYRQILVRKEDQDYQRIVWRKSSTDPIVEYRLRTVTYGTSCAPYLAIKVLHQLANDERKLFPNAASVLENDFYVDDLLSGCDCEEEAVMLCKDLVLLLQRGGFLLHKWGTNSKTVLNSLNNVNNQPQDSCDTKLEKTIKAMGILWNPKYDWLELNLKITNNVPSKLTKRIILSDIAKFYDPLGWLSPVVIVAKVFIQKLWLLGIGWDDEVPSSHRIEWLSFRDQINDMKIFHLPRWIGISKANIKVEVHGFSDASNVAYAGVVYVRIINISGVIVKLVAAKTKVAPIKQITIPRLELCGAMLTAKLMDKVKLSLNISDDNVYGWTDSTIVLAWLQKHPNSWKTFVGNRVSEILNVTRSTQWHHVNTKDNPADCASRGIPPSQLADYELWWTGPQWLHTTDTCIVKSNAIHETELEMRLTTNVFNVNEIPKEYIIYKYSSLIKLKRVVAYCLRFITNCKKSLNNKYVLSNESSEFLTIAELAESMKVCIKISQNVYFNDEIDALSKGESVSKKSSVYFLRPFLDENNVLRVGGRLMNANLPRDSKHPFVISGKSHLAKLIVDQTHKQTLHGGPLLMLNVIRSSYWITNVKSLVKLYVRKCVSCIRNAPNFAKQLMGNLPSVRVNISKPFSSSGVDFAGPCFLKSSKLRNAVSMKAYIAIFVCMATKAIHLELVSDLSTNAFIAAFKRFTSRRGHCAYLFSDCGTNFIGANFELTKMLNKAKASLPVELCELLASDGTEWRFIPPASPHFGGLWEAGVRSTKFHINRILGDTKLTFEEYATLLAQIECCLNSRPISAISDSVDDYTALTPGHFLVFGPPSVIPNENLIEVPSNRLNRWQHIEQMLQSFWKRWTQEYLVTMQHRYKWHSLQNPIKLNDLVIVKNESLPPSKWLLGRIIDTHPGNDGMIRVVTVKCSNSTFKRPITKLCLLPLESNLS
jgi:hypothetical protein